MKLLRTTMWSVVVVVTVASFMAALDNSIPGPPYLVVLANLFEQCENRTPESCREGDWPK